MLVATIGGAMLTVLSICGGPAMAQEPQASWVVDEGSTCNRQTGHVTVHTDITNTGDLALTVTVTEVTFQHQSDTAVVLPGASHEFIFDAGPAPLPGGVLAYHVEWDGGSDDFSRNHSPTNACTTTTPPVTTTPTEPGGGGGGTTTQPVAATTTQPVAATTTQPVAATTTKHSPTVSPTSITSTATRTTTGTPVVAPTTVRPGGTAFTGVENVVPLGAIALMLMTGGSGLLWGQPRRELAVDVRRQRDENVAHRHEQQIGTRAEQALEALRDQDERCRDAEARLEQGDRHVPDAIADHSVGMALGS